MSERKKQADFLKGLLAGDDRPEHLRFSEHLQAAERDYRCMKRACLLIIVVTFLALAVLGYLTVLKVPDDMTRLTQAALRFCQALALGSILCLGVFLGLLFWHRALINRLFAEGRAMITTEMHRLPHPAHSHVPTVIVHEGDTAVYHLRTEVRTSSGAEIRSGAKIIALPKAS